MGHKISGLYFPYARCLDARLLKQAILIFDELNFVDPLERRIRETIQIAPFRKNKYFEAWSPVADDYAYLEDEGFLKRIDPRPAISQFDGLLAQALLCDVRDEHFMRVAAEFASRDYWGILREKIAPDTFLANAIAFSGTRFWRDPSTVGFRPLDGDDDEAQPRRSPFQMAVAHDYIPLACGYAVNTSICLLLAETLGLTPLTDDPKALQLLHRKYERAQTFLGKSEDTSMIVKRSPEYLQKYEAVALNVAEALLPADYIDSQTVESLLRFRRNEAEAFARFKEALFELTALVESSVWSPEFELEVIRLIDGKVLPESRKTRDQLTAAYEKIFGGLVQRTAATLTPTLAASFLAGLSSGQVLTLSCAAVSSALTIALPDLLGLWKDRKDVKRNGMSYLIMQK